MYGKTFESKYDGSLVGAGFPVWAVWDYVLTKTHFARIELNPKLLAFVLGGNAKGAEEDVQRAIDFLCAPDPKSRSDEEKGARLVREGQYQYRVVNWDKYQAIKDAADRREYNRIKKQESRARIQANQKAIGPEEREHIERKEAEEQAEMERAEAREMECRNKHVFVPKPVAVPMEEEQDSQSESTRPW